MSISITELILGRLGHCHLCGMYRTLGYHDREIGWDICCGCVEHVENADNFLNCASFQLPDGTNVPNQLGIRRPQPKEVFP
jgi:hypothetical protein